jgi:hypothetical protein
MQPKHKNSPPPALQADWFTRLTGFSERSPDEVRNWISVVGNQLTSHVNHANYQCGRLEIVPLMELRKRVASLKCPVGKLDLSEVVADAQTLHADPENAGAVFQVASQFNLLEMVSPHVTPEQGVGMYEDDPTQGPACAIACGAGTIYRNYFVELDGQIGQTATQQVDCLRDLGKEFGNEDHRLWKMQNGYALPSASGLKEIVGKLQGMPEAELDLLREKLRIGVQWDTQVTLRGSKHIVTQVYCSAMPVAYSELPTSLWAPLAKLILEAAYEATLAVGLLNSTSTGCKSVYLTLLGGGAFGNDPAWILDGIWRAATLYKQVSLDVRIVSYRQSNAMIRQMICDL